MSTPTMQAVQAHDYGGPEVLNLEKAPRPQPQAGQVLVHVHFAGVNPADWKYRAGMYKQFMPVSFPWTPGLDGSGVVEALGPGVTAFQPGQAVYGLIKGSYSEYALADASELVPKPERLSFEEAAAVPVGALTAWGAIEATQVQAGQRVLVHGAAGGVGLFVIQLARLQGAHVTGTASKGNLDFIRSLGAEQAIDYQAGPFETAVHDLDVVIDTVGSDLPQRSLMVLRPGGVLLSIAARPSPDLGQAQGVRIVSAGRSSPDKLRQINEMIAAGQLKPAFGRIFPLSQASRAHELSQTGHTRGRILLRVGE